MSRTAEVARTPLGDVLSDAAGARSYTVSMGMARPVFWLFARSVRRVAREEVTADAPRRALELATGPGWLLEYVARGLPEWQVVGSDISEPMLATARARVLRVGLGQRVPVEYADALDLPYADASLGLVFATNFLHQLDDLTALFREVQRVLAPGGIFLTQAYTRDAPTWAWAAARLHHRVLRAMGSPLEGMWCVLRASHTSEEVRAAFAAAPGLRADVTLRGPLLQARAVRL